MWQLVAAPNIVADHFVHFVLATPECCGARPWRRNYVVLRMLSVSVPRSLRAKT
jgi:hypothetical protein